MATAVEANKTNAASAPVLQEGETRLDWIRATGPCTAAPAIRDVFTALWGAPESGPGQWGYTRGTHWASGAAVYSKPADGREEVTVELSGGVCAQFTLCEQLGLCRKLVDLGCRFSRMDHAVDLRGTNVDVIEKMKAAGRLGHFAGPRKYHPAEFWERGRLVGNGAYFGKRGGHGAMLRAYDKGLQLGQPAECWIRLELEANGKKAQSSYELLANADDHAAGILGVITGAVDFVERRSGRLDRASRLPWWAELCRGIEQLVMPSVVRARPSLERTCLWMKQQVFPTLLSLAEVTADPRQLMPVLRDLGIGDCVPRQPNASTSQYESFLASGTATSCDGVLLEGNAT